MSVCQFVSVNVKHRAALMCQCVVSGRSLIHVLMVGERNMNNCVRKSFFLLKSQSYKKSVDIKTSREKSTTTPKMHFDNKYPITSFKILLCALLSMKLKIRLCRNLIKHSAV